jgi:HD-like signal output (HDOD) protein
MGNGAMNHDTSYLDAQLDELGVSYVALEEGLPRTPFAKPTLPVYAKINGVVSICMLASSSILTTRNLPANITEIETFASQRMRTLSHSLGMKKITLLCMKATVYFDNRLRESNFLTLPRGDSSHYLQVNTQELLDKLGDLVVFTDFPQLNITHDDCLDEDEFSRERVRQQMTATNSIPAFPTTAQAILKLHMRGEFDIDQLVAIFEKDAPIAASILSWANSASVLGGRQEITSTRDALNRIGTKMTMGFAVASSMARSFRTSRDLSSIVHFASYNSLHSAYGARLVSIENKSTNQNDAYLSGLLYNLGELLMLQSFPERSLYYLFTQELNPHLSREVLAREIFKVSFAQSTDLLMEAWKMPSKISGAIRSLASPKNSEHNEIAADIRIWQVMMLDAGLIPYAHAPYGWEQLNSFSMGKSMIEKSRANIRDFMAFATAVGQRVH